MRDANTGPVADEREGLLAFLEQQRRVLKIAAHGLTDEEARQAPSRSELTVGGLVKHVATTERSWIDLIEFDDPPQPAMEDYADAFTLRADETLAGVLEMYAEVARRTERVIGGVADLGEPVPVPKNVPWYPEELEAWSVRWVLLHLIEESARHAGHADIIREHLDGATAMPLLAAAEQWPASPWLQPWTRA
ncbi:DinB family protein [Amycolatopsis magusensis]|uniref:DinB family protein n=1 Tax=Amycolatopsis magusensis TaxID=882444 RepID=UPI003C2B205C